MGVSTRILSHRKHPCTPYPCASMVAHAHYTPPPSPLSPSPFPPFPLPPLRACCHLIPDVRVGLFLFYDFRASVLLRQIQSARGRGGGCVGGGGDGSGGSGHVEVLVVVVVVMEVMVGIVRVVGDVDDVGDVGDVGDVRDVRVVGVVGVELRDY